MATRPLAHACVAAALATSAGCLSQPSLLQQPPPLKSSKDGKPTAADPIGEIFRNELARSDAQQSELLQPVTVGQDAVPARPNRAAEDRAAASNDADTGATNADATIEALRRKSESYARALEVLMLQRAADSAPKASAVHWIDPASYQLSLGDPNERKNPTAQPPPSKQPAASKVAANPDSAPTEVAEAARPPTDPAGEADASNSPLTLAEVSDKPAVALVTSQRQTAIETPSISLPTTAGDSTLSTRLSKRIQDNPRDIASHLDYQMLLFLRDEQVPNLAAIAPLPQEDRELVTAVLDGLSNLRSTLRRDANLMIAEKIKPMVELADRLKTTAELTVPTMVLASKVAGFGQYDLMDPRLIAGRESPAIVYCEIANFSSQINSNQEWETNLSMEVVLFSEMGQQVYQDLPAKITDTSRSRRHDFFVRKLIKFPSNLTIGRYVLKVTMVDTQSNRVAETSLPVQVVAQ